MDFVRRVLQAGQTIAGSPSRLRLILFAAVVSALGLASVAAVGLPGSYQWPNRAGSALSILAAAALLTAALFVIRRRRRLHAADLRRALRRLIVETPREPEPASRKSSRELFLSALDQQIRSHIEEGRQLAVHRIDIDCFRRRFHALGSDVSGAVLDVVLRRLTELTGEPHHLTQVDDDEFAILQPETGGPKHGEIFAARIQRVLEQPITLGGTEVRLMASIGLAVCPDHGADAGTLLHSADLALKAAQQGGRGSIRCFTAEMADRLERRRALELAIRRSLDGDGFLLRYQPQYDLGSRRLLGFEAQVWLDDPKLGELKEAEFAPIAEEIGLLDAVCERTLSEACREARQWPLNLRLGLRLLLGHCRSRDLIRLLSEALKANHLSPGRLVLQVSEEVVSSGPEQAREQLRRLADMGFRLVLDGYGSGHSGPADLWGGPFAAVKIDAGLVGRIGSGEAVEPLVGAMVKLAQALGLEAIADGAERVEQVHFLMLNGCRHVSGPVLGPAVAADKVAGLIDKDARMDEAGEEASAA